MLDNIILSELAKNIRSMRRQIGAGESRRRLDGEQVGLAGTDPAEVSFSYQKGNALRIRNMFVRVLSYQPVTEYLGLNSRGYILITPLVNADHEWLSLSYEKAGLILPSQPCISLATECPDSPIDFQESPTINLLLDKLKRGDHDYDIAEHLCLAMMPKSPGQELQDEDVDECVPVTARRLEKAITFALLKDMKEYGRLGRQTRNRYRAELAAMNEGEWDSD